MSFLPVLVDMSNKNIREATKARLDMEEFQISEINHKNLPIDFKTKALQELCGDPEGTEKLFLSLAAVTLTQYHEMSTAESAFLIHRVWIMETTEIQDGKSVKVPSLRQIFFREYAAAARTTQGLEKFLLEALNEVLNNAQREAVIGSMEVYKILHNSLFAPKSIFLINKDLVFKHMRGEELTNEELLSAAKERRNEAYAILFSTSVWIHNAVLSSEMKVLMNSMVYQLLKDILGESQDPQQMNGLPDPTNIKGVKV